MAAQRFKYAIGVTLCFQYLSWEYGLAPEFYF